MNTTPARSTTSARFNTSSAALWASAFVILALIIIQAGRLPGNSANASTVADRGSYTLLTARNGNGSDAAPNEILCVIDSREGSLLVYDIEDVRRGGIIQRDGYSLADLFTKARH